MSNYDDTISAISTVLGEGAIQVLRISGNKSLEIADKIFIGKEKLSQMPSHTVRYGFVVDLDTGEIIDEVLATVMLSPRTFTKEDTIEISCHGGIISAKRILNSILKAGARLAEPGEFTKRAFLNGRIDLSQAESVADIIKAKTDLEMKVAFGQLQGKLSNIVESIRSDIEEITAQIEAILDFPDDDIDFSTYESLSIDAERIINELSKLLNVGKEGKIVRDGLKIAIIGKPNVGKSSLLNGFLKEDRAIVTPFPGTTRDSIEEFMNLNGVPIKFIDTAGLRDTQDLIEQEGIRRTKLQIEDADLLLILFDVSQPLDNDDFKLLEEYSNQKNVIFVLNKIDLPRVWEGYFLCCKIQPYNNNVELVEISAKESTGLDNLQNVILNKIFSGNIPSPEEMFLSNTRHIDAIRRAKESMERAISSIKQNLSGEFVAVDLRSALDALGEITGETTTDDILNRIFNEFCIGK
jgi:tRNA modification GTPase